MRTFVIIKSKEGIEMINSEFKLLNLQLVIYTPEIYYKKNIILQKIMESFSDKFDGDIISFPIPDDAPKEIPRLSLSDSQKKFKFDTSINRADFHIFLKEPFEIDTYLSFYFELIQKYIKCTNASIGRMAIVVTKFIEKENPANFLVKYFGDKTLAENKQFNDLNDFELHLRKIISLNNFKINSWVRCKNAKVSFGNNKNLDSVLVIQDMNTFSEEIELKKYSIKNLKEFINLALDEQSNILKNIFK